MVDLEIWREVTAGEPEIRDNESTRRQAHGPSEVTQRLALAVRTEENVAGRMENYLKEMLVTLTGPGVEFVVGGGVACVLQVVERVTLDLDIAVEMSAANLDRLVNAVERLKLQPRIPLSLTDIGDPDFVRSMVTEKGALVFSLTHFTNPLRHLGIFLSPALSFDRLSEGANWFEIGGTKVRVASKELLIKTKTKSNRFVQKIFSTCKNFQD
jgi:hypothetical protein